MKQSIKQYQVDMCRGPLFQKIVFFSVPLMLTGILQLFYNAVNIVVVGRFVGNVALAAVGSTTALITLIVNLFIGLSTGAGVVMARFCGADQRKSASETLHTSIALSLVSGIVLTALGLLMTKPLLRLMGTPDDVLESAVLYMRIYFLGMPASMIYNFGSSVLRAVGDTRRPLYILTLSGVTNILLNLVFVLVFHMDVAGVAWATVISQFISIIFILYCLVRSNDDCIQLRLHKIRFRRAKLLDIIKIGLPAGLQSVIFSVANVLVQSSVNSFGSTVMAGNAAAMNIEGFVYIAMSAVFQAALIFTGQNMGAKLYHRIGRILSVCSLLVATTGLLLGGFAYLFSRGLLGIYTTDSNVIAIGVTRMGYICTLYFVCGIMDVLIGCLRGMGYSILPTMVSVIGACGIRIAWIYTIFARDHSLTSLYLSYPVSWAITACVLCVCYLVKRRKMSFHVAN